DVRHRGELRADPGAGDADEDVGEEAVAPADDHDADPAGEAADDDERKEVNIRRAEQSDRLIHLICSPRRAWAAAGRRPFFLARRYDRSATSRPSAIGAAAFRFADQFASFAGDRMGGPRAGSAAKGRRSKRGGPLR